MSIREESAMRVLRTHRRWPSRVAYGASGRQLVTLSCDPALVAAMCFQFWDVGTLHERLRETMEDSLGSLWRCLFEPNGAAFLRAGGYWPEGEEWPVPGPPRPEHSLVLEYCRAVSGWLGFGADGRTFLTERAQVMLCDFTERRVQAFQGTENLMAVGAAFSADGGLLALHSPGNEVQLHEVATGALLGILAHSDAIGTLRFSPAAPVLATAAGRTVRLWDARERRLLARFRAFRKFAPCLAFSADGRLLAAGSNEGRVRVWEVASGREVADLAWGKGEVVDLAFAPDLMTAAAACQKKAVVIWDVDV
jgi:WD40 repeat protein